MAENLKHPSSGFAGASRLNVRFTRFLRLKWESRFSILILGLMIISNSIGCRSGMWGNRDTIFPKPNLGKMAFWKKENAMPSPPAMHFQPASAGEQQLAASDPSQSNQSFQNTEQELKQSMEAMAAATEDGFDRATEELATMADKLRNQPARSPFSLSSDKEMESQTNQSDFAGSRDFTPNQKSNPINSLAAVAGFNPAGNTEGNRSQPSRDDFSPTVADSSVANQPDNSLAKARQDFLAAMNNTTTTWNNAAVATQENLDSLKNNLRDEFQPQQKLEQVSSFVNQQVANQQQQLNQDFANAQQEIQQFRNQLANTKQQMLAPLASASLSPLSPNANQLENQSNVTLNANPNSPSATASRTIATIGPLDGGWPSGEFQPDGNAASTSRPAEGNVATQFAATSPQYSSTGMPEFKPNHATSNLSPVTPASQTPDEVRLAGLERPGGNASQFGAPQFGAPQFGAFPAASNEPVNNFSPATSKSNEGLDVVIPDAILNSRGGYAPGSLNRIHLR